MASSIQSGFKWITVAQDIYEQRLKKEFTDPSCKMDWVFQYNDPIKGIVLIQRPNHGLAHTLRCATYIPLVARAYAQFKNTLPVSSFEIENIQLALLFYVVGRENDAGSKEDPYLKFRHKSAEIYGIYARSHFAHRLTEDQIQFYQAILTDSCNPTHALYSHYVITRISHNIDLLRCVSSKVYEKAILKSDLFSQNIGGLEIQKLARIVKECLRQTGDRIGDERFYYEDSLFGRCSTNVYFCLRQINKGIRWATLPIQPSLSSASHPNVENLLNLLCSIIENEEVKHHSTLLRFLDTKVETLLSLAETTPLDQKDLWLYNAIKRLFSKDGKIRHYLIDLLLKHPSVG